MTDVEIARNALEPIIDNLVGAIRACALEARYGRSGDTVIDHLADSLGLARAYLLDQEILPRLDLPELTRDQLREVREKIAFALSWATKLQVGSRPDGSSLRILEHMIERAVQLAEGHHVP